MTTLHCVLVGAIGAGCTAVASVASPASYITAKQPARIWVLPGPNQRTVTVDAPRVIGDTIVGTVNGEAAKFPLGEGSSVRAEQVSVGRTLALVMVSGAALAGLYFAYHQPRSAYVCYYAPCAAPGCPPC